MTDHRIRYGCMEGCTDYEERGLTACNDCVTEWQLYVNYYQSSLLTARNRDEKTRL